MVVGGAREDLAASVQRLGADIVVFPWGTRLEELQGGHLMKITRSGWIPRSYVHRITSVRGVGQTSPQLYLATLKGSRYAATAEAYLVAFDPRTDFALSSWIDPAAYRELPLNHAVVGAHILDADGADRIEVDGYELTLAGQLAQTGTDLDETIFVGFDTAQAMNDAGRGRPEALVRVSPMRATTVLVKVRPGWNTQDVTANIMDNVPGAIALPSAAMLQKQRGQLVGLLATVIGLMVTIWVLAVTFIGLVFTLTVNARRRQIGVLRSLGATAGYSVRALAGEGALLGFAGGVIGALVAAAAGQRLETISREQLGVPFAAPEPAMMAVLALAALGLATLSVTMASTLPALHASRGEPALVMRE
jgi:putative ABC transport system permease protein